MVRKDSEPEKMQGFPAELMDALERAQKALEAHPNSARRHSEVGLLLDRGGKPREAIDVMRKAVQLAPKRAIHHDELGMIYRRAAVSIDAFMSRGNNYAPPVPAQRVPGGEDTCWRGAEPTCFQLEYYKRNQLHIAEDDFLRRTQADDTDHHGFILLATLYRNRSVDSCATALRLDPKRPAAYLTIARTLPRGGSVALYKHALALLPQNANLYRELGGLLGELRYYNQANTAFRTSIELEPSSHLGYEALADLRLLRNRPDDAIALAEQSLALHPDAPQPPNAADPRLLGRAPNAPSSSSSSSSAASGDRSFGSSWWWPGGETIQTGPRDSDLMSGPKRRRASQKAREAADRAAQSPRAMAISAAIAIMAEARCQQAQWDEAASLARSAVAISPESVRGYKQLTHALFEQVEGRRRTRIRDYDGFIKSDDVEVDDGSLGTEAIAAGEATTKLAPRDAAAHYRTGRMLRRVPGQLQSAIDHFNGCILANGTYPGVQEAQEEAVERMKSLKARPQGTMHVLFNMLPAIVIMLGLSYLLIR